MNKRYAKGTNGNAKGHPDSEGVDEYRKQFGVEENVHRRYKGFSKYQHSKWWRIIYESEYLNIYVGR